MEKKVCLITGGTSGIGKYTALAMRSAGYAVFEISRRAEGIDGIFHISADITDESAVQQAVSAVLSQAGHIDVLINCASYGAGYGKGSQLEYMEDDVFNKGVDGSLGVVFRGMREVVPFMKKTGGSIINYCSMYGIVSPDLRIYGDNPQKQPPNYGAGKAGVAQITRYAAGSLAQYGIRVNSITPGPFPNPRNQDDAAFNAQLANKTMLGRFGQSYEIAGAILLLASDASSFMTGSNVTVDGGWTAW